MKVLDIDGVVGNLQSLIIAHADPAHVPVMGLDNTHTYNGVQMLTDVCITLTSDHHNQGSNVMS